MSSRHEFEAKIPGHSVSIGWDNPMTTFFAQVERTGAGDEEDSVVLWLGGNPREISAPEAMTARLRPYFDLTEAHIQQLREDRFADVDRAPSTAQRDGLAAVDEMRRRFGRADR